MKALTLREPFASLVAYGDKQIDTRGWSTPYRGPLAIHAGLNVMSLEEAPEAWELLAGRPIHPGHVVAVAQLVGVDEAETAPNEREAKCGWYGPGRQAWQLENVQRLVDPVPARGKQGLWDWHYIDSMR